MKIYEISEIIQFFSFRLTFTAWNTRPSSGGMQRGNNGRNVWIEEMAHHLLQVIESTARLLIESRN